jgi:hypothetical protein
MDNWLTSAKPSEKSMAQHAEAEISLLALMDQLRAETSQLLEHITSNRVSGPSEVRRHVLPILGLGAFREDRS